jgi:hypothetical protein
MPAGLALGPALTRDWRRVMLVVMAIAVSGIVLAVSAVGFGVVRVIGSGK